MRHRSKCLRTLALVLLASPAAPCLAAPPPAPAPAEDSAAPAAHADHTLTWLTGPDFNTGTYGTARRITVDSWTDGLNWNPFDQTTLGVFLPYIVQRAPAGTVAGKSIARLHPHLGKGRDVTTDGIGDLLLSVDQDLLVQGDDMPLDVGLLGQVKVPTASVSRGLGTGKADYTLEASLARSLGQFYAEVRGGYAFIGSPGRVSVNGVNENLRYRDVWMGSAALNYDVSDSWIVGGAFHTERSSERLYPPVNDVTLNSVYRLRRSVRVNFSALRGFTRSSPDWGASVGLGVDLR